MENGRIVLAQVQVQSLKVPGASFGAHDPSGIRSVPALALDEGGVTGIGPIRELIPDVHHRNHPESKNRGDNGVSVGFTSHYDGMRARFPGGLDDGQAGENLLIETNRTWSEFDLGSCLVVHTRSGPVRLRDVIVADPCVEFARWLLDVPVTDRPDASVADPVRFLGTGVRGCYAAVDGVPARVVVGDVVRLAAREQAPDSRLARVVIPESRSPVAQSGARRVPSMSGMAESLLKLSGPTPASRPASGRARTAAGRRLPARAAGDPGRVRSRAHRP